VGSIYQYHGTVRSIYYGTLSPIPYPLSYPINSVPYSLRLQWDLSTVKVGSSYYGTLSPIQYTVYSRNGLIRRLRRTRRALTIIGLLDYWIIGLLDYAYFATPRSAPVLPVKRGRSPLPHARAAAATMHACALYPLPYSSALAVADGLDQPGPLVGVPHRVGEEEEGPSPGGL